MVTDTGVCGSNLRVKWNATATGPGGLRSFRPTGYFPVYLSQLQTKNSPEISLTRPNVLATREPERTARRTPTPSDRLRQTGTSARSPRRSAGTRRTDVRSFDDVTTAARPYPLKPRPRAGVTGNAAATGSAGSLHVGVGGPATSRRGGSGSIGARRLQRGTHIACPCRSSTHTLNADNLARSGTVYVARTSTPARATTYPLRRSTRRGPGTMVRLPHRRGDERLRRGSGSGWRPRRARAEPRRLGCRRGGDIIALENPLAAVRRTPDATEVFGALRLPIFDPATGPSEAGPGSRQRLGKRGVFKTREAAHCLR